MKIRKLHINRFGHFHECDLEFPGDGLQVIYGPNEAGKTTLLEFLRDLLFDFPSRTAYDFGGPGKIAGVGNFEMKDGRNVELRRRKGNKDKVAIRIDGKPTDFDDVEWSRLLDRADRSLFESVFAFGLSQLSQGEDSLRHESVQSALFGGSLGGVISPDQVITDLTKQADELFKKGGSKPAINAHLSEIKRLSKEIKERQLRPQEFHNAEVAVETTAKLSQELHDQVEQLRREHAKIEKLVTALPKWHELQISRSERDALNAPINVPPSAGQQFQELAKELTQLETEQTRLTGEIQQLEGQLAAVHRDPDAVSYRAEIKSCLELRQSYIEAKKDLPERKQQRDDIRRMIDRELKELRPGWTYDDLQSFSIDFETRNLLDRLSREHRERATTLTKLTGKRDGDAANLEQANDDLKEIDTSRDVSELAMILASEADFVANRKQLKSLESELAKLERKLGTQQKKLSPPLPATFESPQTLPVPRSETVTEFENTFATFTEELRIVTSSLEEDTTKQQELENQLQAAMSKHSVPSLEERDAAREQREIGWKLIRSQYISQNAKEEEEEEEVKTWLDTVSGSALPEAYERAVHHADDIADQIYDNAHEVAEREGWRQQLAALKQRIDQKRERIENLKAQQAENQAAWVVLWHACDFEPLAPTAMLGWLKDHAAYCETVAQRDELLVERAQLRQKMAAFEEQIGATRDATESEVTGLLATARQTVDEVKEAQRRSSDLQKQIRRLEKLLEKHDAELNIITEQSTAAGAELQDLLKRLNLPDHWDIELTREAIEKLHATRIRLDSLPGEEARISAMQTRIEEFDQRVKSLCQAVNAELLRDAPELAMEKLEEQVVQAGQAQRRYEELELQLETARTQLKTTQEQHTTRQQERTRLFELAEVETEAEFIEVVARVEKFDRLSLKIEQLAHDLDLIRGSEDRDSFEQTLASSELSVLQGQESDLREQLATLETSRKDANGEEALAREALRQLRGSEEVAMLLDERARRRSLLASEVDRYLPVVYARHLLKAAVSRFEKENQPEMIATVSDLLSKMTEGRYVEFDRMGGGKQNILVRAADGIEKTPDQLSTGTREQLYLAIRLAYVLHYSKKNQPLPIVIDDVLVNFDDQRTRQTLRSLSEISKSVQVLFFTCHPHMVEIAREVVPELKPIDLSEVTTK